MPEVAPVTRAVDPFRLFAMMCHSKFLGTVSQKLGYDFWEVKPILKSDPAKLP
jgi:hypothetical protein